MNPLCPYTGGSSRIIRDMDLAGWYESDNLSENLRAVIPRVVLVQESEPNSSDSEFEWEVQGEMSEAATPLMLNDSPDDGVEESSFELLGLPSAGSVRVDNGSSSTSATSLPALPSSVATNAMSLLALPSAASAASLPALPSAATATSLPALPSATSSKQNIYFCIICAFFYIYMDFLIIKVTCVLFPTRIIFFTKISQRNITLSICCKLL